MLNLVFFVWNFDNSVENNIYFYNQFEFWKKVEYVSRNSIFCNTCRPFSIIKKGDARNFGHIFVFIVFAPNLSA